MKAAFSQKFLERLGRRRETAQSDELVELGRQAQAAGQTGPLIIGSAELSRSPRRRRNGKEPWREDARKLAELYPEEFGPLRDQTRSGSTVSAPASSEPTRAPDHAGDRCPHLVTPTLPAPAAEPQCPVIAPGPSDSASVAAKASPPPTQLLQSGFWQALLFGNPDSLFSSFDATQALHLVAEKLGVPIDPGETTNSLRGGELRKQLRSRFGQAEAEGAMNKLWRAAPLTDGCPLPNLEDSDRSPGPLPGGRAQPRWVRDLHDPDRLELEERASFGGWGGG
jgi:hypothetical protein